MLKRLLLQKIVRTAVDEEEIDFYDIFLSVRFGKSKVVYNLNEHGYFEADENKPQGVNQYVVFPKITEPKETAHSSSQTESIIPIQAAKLAESIRKTKISKKMESEAKKMKFQENPEKIDIKEEPTDEVEIMVVEEDEMAEESMIKSEPNEVIHVKSTPAKLGEKPCCPKYPVSKEDDEIDHAIRKRVNNICKFGEHLTKRGGRTQTSCGFCFAPVCRLHVYEVCPSCIIDKNLAPATQTDSVTLAENQHQKLTKQPQQIFRQVPATMKQSGNLLSQPKGIHLAIQPGNATIVQLQQTPLVRPLTISRQQLQQQPQLQPQSFILPKPYGENFRSEKSIE
ncbi:Oidioi.mRNA.OKI2018_I69.PAR.g11409.t1.cds [Oikopleura dioica]|uniref:Oidioi.mRNA.OKI2018_I69.PAR.g11409.t1.cds n=1 Tax=Oikopleura dioica TaxID=34765 RepID=A0ABN7RVG5_OIKDI|nr:Oidioi.mRNA.OKI2018_I69.PAR.g11409.t1.cds [Oikopleura dioica]